MSSANSVAHAHGNFGRVAAERGYVLVHPAKGCAFYTIHTTSISIDGSIYHDVGDVRTILKTQVPNARPLHLFASQEPEHIETIGMSVEGLQR